MSGLYELKSWTIEWITRIKTDQTILSLLVGSMERAVAFFGDEVRPVHLPPGKEEEGTALPPDELDRTFSPVGSVVRRRVRPYGFRTSELGLQRQRE